MKKKEIEIKIEDLERERLKAIKEQNYARVALMRDKVRELMVKSRKL